MKNILSRIIILAVALLLASEFVSGFGIDSLKTTLLAALTLAIVNTFIKPVVIFLTLPLTILTLGLFILVINTSLLAMVAWLVDGFTIDSIFAPVVGSVLVSTINLIITYWVDQDND
jgi:putative membrane protein